MLQIYWSRRHTALKNQTLKIKHSKCLSFLVISISQTLGMDAFFDELAYYGREYSSNKEKPHSPFSRYSISMRLMTSMSCMVNYPVLIGTISVLILLSPRYSSFMAMLRVATISVSRPRIPGRSQ